MRAHILSIGSELLLGHITDSNATFLAQEFATLGIELTMVKQVSDQRDAISLEIQRSLQEVDMIVATGGIGPTVDDQTREAIADAVVEVPFVDVGLLDTVRSFFAARSLEMPERNAKQAWIIDSAEPLANPNGTAPGWFVSKAGKLIVAMPGVPREMYPMWQQQVVHRIGPMLGANAISTITLKTIGIGESALEELLGDIAQLENPAVATYAKDDGVHIRVTGIAETEREAEALRDMTAQKVLERAGTFIYGTNQMTLPSALCELLAMRHLKLSVLDVNAGGRFWSLMAADSAAKQVMTTGVMVLAEDQLERDLSASSGMQNSTIRMEITVSNDDASGVMTVSLDGPAVATETATMRGSLPELQRRSALFAADVLKRYLEALPESGP